MYVLEHESQIVDRKIPYSTQWLIFFHAFPQVRLSKLIAHSVCRSATLKGNAPSQALVWPATLPRYACELPFLVANAGRQTSYSIEALYTSIAGTH